MIGNWNFELTLIPKLVFVPGKTIGSESIELINNRLKLGIASMIFSGTILSIIEIFPLLSTKSVILTVSLTGLSIKTFDKFKFFKISSDKKFLKHSLMSSDWISSLQLWTEGNSSELLHVIFSLLISVDLLFRLLWQEEKINKLINIIFVIFTDYEITKIV